MGATAIVLLTAGVLGHQFVHDCIHDEIIKNSTGPGKVQVNYGRDRRGTPQAFTSMRIKWFWGEEQCATQSGSALRNCYCTSDGDQVPDFQGAIQTCSAAQVMSPAKKAYIGQVMDAAALWLTNALKVEPVVGNLKTGDKIVGGFAAPADQPYCGASNFLDTGVLTPMDHHTTGVADADFLVYVSAVPTSGNTVAWALTCMSDQVDRPIGAQVNWGPTRIDETNPVSSTAFANYVATGVHEMMHALGFSSGHWGGKANWFAAHCAAQGTPNCKPTIEVTERGNTVTKMATPEVLSAVREYSACNSLNGAEIENEGGSGTAGSHWEKRVFGPEAMTGVSGSHESVWSKMTLAYFKDTGHYDVDYSVVGSNFFWGKSRGCDFWTKKCNEIAPAGPEFCFPADPAVKEEGCDYTMIGGGYCDVVGYSSCLDPQYQYFAGQCTYGASQSGVTDFCPTWKAYSNSLCNDPSAASTGGLTDANLGNSRADNARCFKSNLHEAGVGFMSGAVTRCFIVECAADCNSYVIKIAKTSGGYDEVTCSAAGLATLPGGFSTAWTGGGPNNAEITCHDPVDVCQGRGNMGNVCGATPTESPSQPPSTPPSGAPSTVPSTSPTAGPTMGPSSGPTKSPLKAGVPTQSPVAPPTATPTSSPTASPRKLAGVPSTSPSAAPSAAPSVGPSMGPTKSPLKAGVPTQ
eukprot:Hpha_TRINITY_DN15826_c3_g6::TRINITY_DN15826_c3_g6_i1::g.190110::m.190110/K01404/GP63; leishmanolysin